MTLVHLMQNITKLMLGQTMGSVGTAGSRCPAMRPVHSFAIGKAIDSQGPQLTGVNL
jgi:hypothetical protein